MNERARSLTEAAERMEGGGACAKQLTVGRFPATALPAGVATGRSVASASAARAAASVPACRAAGTHATRQPGP